MSDMSRLCWDIIEDLRSDGWLVVVKAMPEGHSFTIPGNRSEYDAPAPDVDIWEGKTVVSLSDMKWRYDDTEKFRGDHTGVGDELKDALADVINKMEEYL